MAYPPEFLDRLRAAVRVSEVVGRKWHLRRAGSEFVVNDNRSFSINDKKGIWKDFGNGGEKGGDVFDFLEAYDGLTFPAAVECVARLAGIPLPRNGNGEVNPRSAAPDSGHSLSGRNGEGEAPRRERGSTGRRIVVGHWD